ncbi:unnamed protein product [Rotaria sordida]|uniref:MATH domain-containing protein n=1 Tax=Rotaria sordida TaxID=392033 RepID=A0A819MRC2_9BILA|nr:unnamed protein product [Rotaria sordida]
MCGIQNLQRYNRFTACDNLCDAADSSTQANGTTKMSIEKKCSTCNKMLNRLIQLKCGHIQCDCCIKYKQNKTVSCSYCYEETSIEEITSNELLPQETNEELPTTCPFCSWSGPYKDYKNEDLNKIYLHIQTVTEVLAEIMSLNSANHSSNDAALYVSIDDVICVNDSSMKLDNCIMNLNESNIDNPIFLEQQDDQNDHKIDELNELITRLSAEQPTDVLNDDTQDTEVRLSDKRCLQFHENHIQTSQEIQQMKQEINSLQTIINVLHMELMARPVATDGLLIWPIEDIREKINNALCLKEPFVQSPTFVTVANGHPVQVYLYLHGKTSTEYHSSLYISIYVKLIEKVRQNLKGNVTFCIVDQSNSHYPSHVKRTCIVNTMNSNDMIGFDHLMVKNCLYQDPSPYIHDNTIWVIVKFNQTNPERFANLPKCVQHALENIG